MKKLYIVLLLSLFLVAGCSNGNSSVLSGTSKYSNDLQHNIANNIGFNGGIFAVHNDEVYFYSKTHQQLTSNKIGTDKYDVKNNFDRDIIDLNFIGDDLIYLTPYMEVEGSNGKELSLYTISSYNVSNNKSSIDLSPIDSLLDVEQVTVTDKLPGWGNPPEDYYPSITDILIINDYIFISIRKNLKSEEWHVPDRNVFRTGQYVLNYKTGELNELQLGNTSDSSPVEFFGYYKASNGEIRYYYKEKGSSGYLAYFTMTDKCELANDMAVGGNTTIYYPLSIYDDKVVFMDIDGTYLMNLEDETYEQLSNKMAEDALIMGDTAYISFDDGLSVFDLINKKWEKVFDYSGDYTLELSKFNHIIYMGYPEKPFFEYNMKDKK